MSKREKIIVIAILGLVGFIAMLNIINNNAHANFHTPFPSAVCGQGLHIGNPHCSPHPSATATASPTPSASPSPTINPCDVEELEYWNENPCPTGTPQPTATPSGTPEPTLEPSATPSATPAPQVESSSSSSNPDAPACGNSPTNLLPINPHVWRNGDTARVEWQPTEGDNVNIYYKQVSSPVWQYSLSNQPNNGHAEIHGLGTLDITFAIQQTWGCGGGPLTDAIVDGATSGWVWFGVK